MSGPIKELWQMEAEKAGGPVLVAVLEDMREKIDGIVARNARTDQVLDKLVSGFPDGDAEAHRRYHEAVIEKIELRNRLVREALTKAVGSGFLAGSAWLLYAIWQAFTASVHKGG